jgi:hypothetical protein
MEEAMSLHRTGPICGLLFTPIYAAFVFIPRLPEASYTDEQVLDLYRDPGASSAILLSSLLIGIAGGILLVFLADLWDRLRSAGALATLAVSGGVLYVGMLFLAGAFWGGYAGGGAGPLEAAPDLQHSATLARVLTDTGFEVLLIYGLLAAAVMVVATSAAAQRTGILPHGVVIAGYVIAALLLAGFAWIPQFLVPLWVLTVSINFLRSPAIPPAKTHPVPAT